MSKLEQGFLELLAVSLEGEPAAIDRERFIERLKVNPEELDAYVEAHRFEQELRAAAIRNVQLVDALERIQDESTFDPVFLGLAPGFSRWAGPLVSAAAALAVSLGGAWWLGRARTDPTDSPNVIADVRRESGTVAHFQRFSTGGGNELYRRNSPAGQTVEFYDASDLALKENLPVVGGVIRDIDSRLV